jgi:PKHD-type hydroxylase
MGGVRGQPMRSDLSFTVALTDPADYRGGEFVAQTPFGEERLKLEAGNAIVYPSSMIHRVDPIEDGTRWAAIGWIQSMVRDDGRREIIYEIDQLRGIVTREMTGADIIERFDHLRGNLIRLWAEV